MAFALRQMTRLGNVRATKNYWNLRETDGQTEASYRGFREAGVYLGIVSRKIAKKVHESLRSLKNKPYTHPRKK